MYIKFLAHGKGDPAKAASYLIDEVDHLNRPRADVQVLSGDPLASIALILLISSIALGYVSKSKYNDINEMQNKVDYLKSQGGSMFTMECGGKLCVELDPNVKESYALDNGTRPLGIVREVR